VAKLKGNVPAGARIELQTAGRNTAANPRAADLNIRNSPARILSNGLTPLPASLEPLIVKGWTIDDDLKQTEAPQYTLRVVPPEAEAGKPMKSLHTQNVTPAASWYRAQADSVEPTLEITLP
jgi:hypothetical protein